MAGAGFPSYFKAVTIGTLTVTGQALAGSGTSAAPSYSFTSATGDGLYLAGSGDVRIATGGLSRVRFNGANTRFLDGSENQQIVLQAQTASIIFGAAEDLQVGRFAAASFRIGKDPSATPIAQTFTIGEASRPGTDTNVGGASATLRPGLGTGTGTAPKFAIQGVVLTGTGTDVQTYTDMIAVTGVALGFYGAAPVAQQTGVAVSAAGVHAALVNLGLITA